MSETPEVTYNWEEVTGRTVERLREPKVAPVPAPIVKLAQASYDEKSAKHYTCKTEAMAAELAKHLKNAGSHTSPQTSVAVVIDPEHSGNKKIVGWKTGDRRGRNTATAS